MAELFIIIGRIIGQGPLAALPGDTLELPVYGYEVVEGDGGLAPGARIDVAHRDADPDDPGFAVGRLRRLELTREIPKAAVLLFFGDQSHHSQAVWFCPRSSEVPRSSAPTRAGR
jgi:hypothetical protein